MIVILFGPGGPFPNGTAPTARVLSYARGLVAQNCRVVVLCLGPSEYQAIGVFNHDIRGVIDGIEFEYTCGTTIRGQNRFQQGWLVIKGLAVGARRILQLLRQGPVDALVLYPDRLVTSLWFWLIARLSRASFLLEKSEMPFLQAEESRFWRLYRHVYTHTVYKLFDGFIVISDYLFDYITPRLKRDAAVLKVPILVDVDEFSPAPQTDIKGGSMIVYCGTLNEAKDGVLTLMRAFALIHGDFPDLQLVLIGDALKISQIPAYLGHAKALGIIDQVVFTGVLKRSALPDRLAKATVLALARPSSKQAEAGFPTKLGEYLATGNPVVVTATGEIAAYLADGVSAYLVPPDSAEAFAERLRFVLTHPEAARSVGRAGREVAVRSFDNRTNGGRIIEFVHQLQTTKHQRARSRWLSRIVA